jgi:two-component system sensor histidine kinase EvgS
VLIDPVRFKQVLSNLLSNAIKFTEQGEVSVRLSVRAMPLASVGVTVVIEDSGIGISEQDRQRLFSPFVQAGNAGQSARSGSGLGLVISRELCEMMGGTLRLDSEPGHGTRSRSVCNCNRWPRLPPRLQAPRWRTPARSLSVLVVDDHPVNRLLLCWQLSELGHRTVDIEDGEQGLQRWRAHAFDVLITDCNMPRRNGYELARAIRGEEAASGRARCLILGFTANAQIEEKARCLEAGMDDCLFKPIRLADLALALQGAGHSENAGEPKPPLPLTELD